MEPRPILSLIVPTRGRPARLQGLLASLAQTVAEPAALEVILVVDADDPASQGISEPPLTIRYVIVPPGQTMGRLNLAGYEAARGRWLMLLNDDVTARTPGWDRAVRRCIAAFPDEIALLHVNDLVLQRHLCAFPIVSRTFCEITGGICPPQYRRYRIDDHIEDYFNLLGVLGERRIVFLPNVIFEHANYVETAPGLRQYFADPDVLAEDAVMFDASLADRKQTALRLKALILARRDVPARWRERLLRVHDSLLLRTIDRQRILIGEQIVDPWDLEPSWRERLGRCLRERGWRGLVKAALWRLGCIRAAACGLAQAQPGER